MVLGLLQRTVWVAMLIPFTAAAGAAGNSRPALPTALRSEVQQAFAQHQGTAVVVNVESGAVVLTHREEVAARRLAPPGSAIKPFVLAALLESGVISPDTAFTCRGRLRVGASLLDCSHARVARPIRAQEALAYSCNGFFATYSLRLPPSSLSRYLRAFGLTDAPASVPNAAPGRIRESATPEALQLQALGLSGIEVTPLTLLYAFRKLLRLQMKPVALGLQGSVDYGTGQSAGPLLSIAGKTGTSPAGPHHWTHAWFLGYSPREKARYAVVVFLESGRGGPEAAPIAARILAACERYLR
jgi:cell division protein FtsI/penicillin-binding protein 2